jgi:hypothetical protein
LGSLTLELEGSTILFNFRELLRRRKVLSKYQELLAGDAVSLPGKIEVSAVPL